MAAILVREPNRLPATDSKNDSAGGDERLPLRAWQRGRMHPRFKLGLNGGEISRASREQKAAESPSSSVR